MSESVSGSVLRRDITYFVDHATITFITERALLERYRARVVLVSSRGSCRLGHEAHGAWPYARGSEHQCRRRSAFPPLLLWDARRPPLQVHLAPPPREAGIFLAPDALTKTRWAVGHARRRRPLRRPDGGKLGHLMGRIGGPCADGFAPGVPHHTVKNTPPTMAHTPMRKMMECQ